MGQRSAGPSISQNHAVQSNPVPLPQVNKNMSGKPLSLRVQKLNNTVPPRRSPFVQFSAKPQVSACSRDAVPGLATTKNIAVVKNNTQASLYNSGISYMPSVASCRSDNAPTIVSSVNVIMSTGQDRPMNYNDLSDSGHYDFVTNPGVSLSMSNEETSLTDKPGLPPHAVCMSPHRNLPSKDTASPGLVRSVPLRRSTGSHNKPLFKLIVHDKKAGDQVFDSEPDTLEYVSNQPPPFPVCPDQVLVTPPPNPDQNDQMTAQEKVAHSKPSKAKSFWANLPLFKNKQKHGLFKRSHSVDAGTSQHTEKIEKDIPDIKANLQLHLSQASSSGSLDSSPLSGDYSPISGESEHRAYTTTDSEYDMSSDYRTLTTDSEYEGHYDNIPGRTSTRRASTYSNSNTSNVRGKIDKVVSTINKSYRKN